MSSGPLQRMPSPVRAPAQHETLARIIVERQEALLTAPTSSASTPPRAPTARRKTLTGVRIVNTRGITLQRIKRSRARSAAPHAARVEEKLVFHSLGISKDGKDMTSANLDAFTDRFKYQLPPEVIVAMREFFKLDVADVNEVEDALINNGGQGAMDLVVDPGGEGADATIG
ncbi:hypothetical protein ZWY2020_040016 [Hordeum vulgare]|nr:hypothetical protein ZWY2020_040016 [Hordeum vulgare]